MEKLNHRFADQEDYPGSHDQEEGWENREQEYKTWQSELFDDDHDEGDYAEAEEVEYQADAPSDDSATDFDAQFEWRSKRGRNRRGKFEPPDTRGFVAPVFARLANTGAKTSSSSGERRDPGP